MLEWVLYCLLALLVAAATMILNVAGLVRVRTLVKVFSAAGVICAAVVGEMKLREWRALPDYQMTPDVVTDDGHVGSAACRACHPQQYESWHDTYHRTMTQIASKESVLAPFRGETLTGYGMTARAFRRGKEFVVDIVDPTYLEQRETFDRSLPIDDRAPRVELPIVMTTGSHHAQLYWYERSDTGELSEFPWTYRIAEKRWVHQFDALLQPEMTDSASLGHQSWNASCIECHSVAGQPNQHSGTNRYGTASVAELGISCEACHGPGNEHCLANRNPVNRYRSYVGDGPDTTIVNPRRLSPKESSKACGICHSYFAYEDPELLQRRWTEGRKIRPGDDYSSLGRFETVEDEEEFAYGDESILLSRFWEDGTCRVGGREYNGLLMSPCHMEGELSCLSCHSMHHYESTNDQLRPGMDGNDACYQCHAEYRERLADHTHHAPESAGSVCYNCHMPHTSYALLGAVRSHRIDSPSVTGLSALSRLNACNLCHIDRTLGWTAESLDEWYDIPAPAHLSDDEQKTAAAVLWMLKGDAGQRAIAAWHMGWRPAHSAAGSDWIAPLLAVLFDDPYSAVRFNGFRSLQSLDGFKSQPNLYDSAQEKRSDVRQQIVRQWQQQGSTRQTGNTLVSEDGINQAEILRLLEQRDDRRMVINE